MAEQTIEVVSMDEIERGKQLHTDVQIIMEVISKASPIVIICWAGTLIIVGVVVHCCNVGNVLWHCIETTLKNIAIMNYFWCSL